MGIIAGTIASFVRSLNPFSAPEPFEEASDPAFPYLTYHPTAPNTNLNYRFLIIGKLGRGTMSSIWLARDFRYPEYPFVTLKIPCLESDRSDNEWKISRRIQMVIDQLYNSQLRDVDLSLRLPMEKVSLRAEKHYNEPHKALLYQPAGSSVNDMMRALYGSRRPRHVVRGICRQLLEALAFLHDKAGIMHGDLHSGNVLCQLENVTETCGRFEAAEKAKPSKSRERRGMMLYESRPMNDGLRSEVVLTDFGAAMCIKDVQKLPTLDILPDVMRAPEVVLEAQVNEKADIWALGLMVWYLYSGRHLIDYRPKGRRQTQSTHLAWLMYILGEPNPDEFAWIKTGNYTKYCTKCDGTFVYEQVLDFPPYTALEEAEIQHAVCEPSERVDFLRFMRRMLRWRPEDRASAQDLLNDPWLNKLAFVEERRTRQAGAFFGRFNHLWWW